MTSAEFEYLEEGTLLGGRYQIHRPLGAGAMGAVYQAIHTVTRQQVAVKVLFRHVAAAMGGVERFRREVRVAGSIKHPGVVEITDAGEDNGLLFYAMELLEGAPMDVWLARQPPRDEALEVLLEGVDALAAVHRAGAVHRDIKPENFFVLRNPRGPRVKLLDFGIVRDGEAMRATQTGYTLGTPLYMAPEQALNPSEAQPSADVWSLGIMLYEILCGEAPFLGETAQAVCIRSIQEAHEPVMERAPDTPPALAAFVDRCLAKHPDERPVNASEFYAELQLALRAPPPPEPLPAAADAAEDLDLPPAGPPRALLIALAALVLLIAGLAVTLALSMPSEEGAPELDPRYSAATLEAAGAPRTSAPPPASAEPLASAEPPASAEAPSAPAPDTEAPSAEDAPAEASSAQPASTPSAPPSDPRRAPPEVSRRAAPASAEAPPASAAQAAPAEQAPAAPASAAPPASTAPPATAPPATAPPATAPASPVTAPPATAAPPAQDAALPATAAPKRRGSGFVTF